MSGWVRVSKHIWKIPIEWEFRGVAAVLYLATVFVGVTFYLWWVWG